LATRTGFQANSAWLDTPIPAAGNNITVGFDFTMWDRSSSTGADGLTFFLYDAAVPFGAGGRGGSLGYANVNADDGLSGGYLGLGLDVFGNFSNPTEDRNGGVGSRPSEVVLRGPGSGQTGYDYLAGTDGNNTTLGGNPAIDNLETLLGVASNPLAYELQNFRPDQDAEQYRYVEIELTDSNQLIVRMRAGFTGPLVELFTADVSSFARPDLLRIGFSGGTGGVDQVYEVRNLRVDTTGTTNTWYWTNSDSQLWTENDNWVPSSQPVDHADLVFTDQFPDTDAPMVVLVDGADKVIRHAFLSGEHSYTIDPDTNQSWVMDTDGLGASYIAVLSSPNGNADHAINVDLDLNNDLRVQHLVKNQTLTLGGDIDINGNDLYLNSFGILEANGVISDSGDLIVQGSGTKVLTGNNSYSGQTTVEGGVLQIESNNALGGTAAGTTVEYGASLAMAGDITTPAGETLSLTGSGVGGVGALVSVDGDNTWQGDITLADDTSIGALDTASLTLDGAINGAGNALTFVPQSGGTLQIEGVISGAGTDVVYAGQGTSIIGYGQTNTYTGTTTIRSGTVQSNSSVGNFGEEAFGTSNSAIQLGDAATLASDDISLIFNTESQGGFPTGTRVVTGRAINVNDFGNEVTLGVIGGAELRIGDDVNLSRDLILSAASDSSLRIRTDGQLTGTGDIIIEGGGQVTFDGNNSRSGATIINNGTLTVTGATNALDSSGRVTLANSANAALVIDSDETIGSLAGGGATGGNVTINPGETLTVGNDNTNSTYSGSLQGTGNLTKVGTETTTFDGSNDLTGTLSIDSGTVLINANNVFDDAMNLTLSGGTFATNGFSDTMDTFTLTADSAINFRGATGGYLTFDDMTRTGGDLTIDQWAGSLTGNGNTRLQVTAATLGGGLLANTSFTGWGAANLINLGGGLYELVPSLAGFTRWTDGDAGNDDWTDGDNWSDGAPNGKGDRVYFGNDPAGSGTQDVVLDDKKLSVGTLILDSTEHDYQMRASDKKNAILELEGNDGSEANIIVSGNQEHIIGWTNTNKERVNVELKKSNLRIQNNSSAATGLTFGTLDGDHNFVLDNYHLTVTGISRTIIHNQITGNGSITQDDIGILRLTDTNNTFSGGVTLNEGTIEIGSNAALGTGSFTINGGAVEAFGADRSISNAYTINDAYAVNGTNDLTFSGAGTVGAGSHGITVAPSITHTLSGQITGDGGLIKDGDGTLAFTGGTKTFSGGLVVNDGTLDASRNGNITLGTADGANNIAGAGAITVNSGGTFDLTQSGNSAITLRGAPLTNTGGTLNISSTGDNASRDFFIGTDAANTGQLVATGGTTNIDVGDDIRVRANSSISVSGGTVNLNPADAFITEGTAGNAASIAVTGTGSLNIDITGARSVDNAISLGQHDVMTVQGAGASATFTGQVGSAIDINGRLRLLNSGTLTVEQGTTTINATAIVDGGISTSSGTLKLRDDLIIAGDADITNAPNLTFDTPNDISISGTAAETSTKGWGVITQEGLGTTTIDASINNIDANTIVITGGTLMLDDDNQIANTTNMVLAGGTFNTNNHDEIVGTLTLTANSIIDFGDTPADGSILKFADSSGETWNTGATLTVINWDGIFKTGDGIDQLFFGTNGNGLTDTQRAQIVFSDYPGSNVIHLPDGEVVPVPEPGAIAATFGLTALIGWRERKRIQRWFLG
jgi:autotransporter-associated beta strand protein